MNYTNEEIMLALILKEKQKQEKSNKDKNSTQEPIIDPKLQKVFNDH